MPELRSPGLPSGEFAIQPCTPAGTRPYLWAVTGAYSFICKYSSTGALCLRLNQLAWQWRIGDSYWYGDYLAAVPYPGVRIRIVDFPSAVENGWRYDTDIRVRGECTTPKEEIHRAYRELLAQIPAEDIREIDWFD